MVFGTIVPPEGSVVAKYHKPQIAVIIPYYNGYSAFIADALQSVKEQTHDNFVCVVVDDCSDAENHAAARAAVEEMKDRRFKLLRAPRNEGQIAAVFRGLEETSTDFACILDPDDRYAPEFLERMLALHLNHWVIAPIASCDQYLLNLNGGGVVAGTYYHDNRLELSAEDIAAELSTFTNFGFHRFIPPTVPGWHWTSTSAMMFRSAALRLMKPPEPLSYKGNADSYCAQGAHMMGGSLFLREALVYRGLHPQNDFITDTMFSIFQKQGRPTAVWRLENFRIDAFASIVKNGGLKLFDPGSVRELIAAQFLGADFDDLLRAVPEVADIIGLP